MLRFLITGIASICVIGFAWYYSGASAERYAQASHEHQQSLIELQHAEQRMQRLEKGLTHPLLNILGEDVADLQIRLSEQLERWKHHEERLITAYQQSLLPRQIGEKYDVDLVGGRVEGIKILRLDVQATMKHTQHFLTFINELKLATGGWPSEVRACDVQKMPSRRLNARCVLDIYHWSDGDSK